MSRLELKTRPSESEPLTDFVARAVKGQADAVNVAPVLIGSILDELGRKKCNIITAVAHSDDLIDTKIAGIDSAVQAGADEVIIGLSSTLVRNNNWDTLEKELAQFSQLAVMYEILVWVSFDFCALSRVEQVQMLELMPSALGLRLSAPVVEDDVKLVNIVNSDIPVTVVGRTDWSLADRDAEGVHTFAVFDLPEQKRTNVLYKTEGKV